MRQVHLVDRLAKEEFEIRKKLLQINKGINVGTHDPMLTLMEKNKEIAKAMPKTMPRMISPLKSKTKMK